MLSKEELRTRFLSKKQTSEERETKSKAIVSFVELFLHKSPGLWGFFFPLSHEPILEPLFSRKMPFIQACFPKVENKEASCMEYYLVAKDALQNRKDFVRGAWGIWEPQKKHAQLVEKQRMTGILVPLLAFDLKGNRLGRGKGFYDRYLEDFSAQKVGVAFEDQKYEKELPWEHFDVKLDMVITEKRTYSFLLKSK